VQQVVKASGQRTAHVVLGGAAVVILLILLVFGIETVSDILLLYPLYASFKALKTKDKNDDTQWLTYWILVGCVMVVEEVFEDLFGDDDDDDDDDSANSWLLGFVYYLAKIAFFFWAADPSTKGAEIVYNKGIAPVFEKVEAFLEKKQ